MKRYIWDIVSIIALCAVILVFFGQVFVGKLPVPSDSLVGLYHPWRDYYAADYPRGVPFKNFLITDPVRQQIPWKKIVIDTWKQGQIPWWNPYSFSGAPLAANIQSAAFYPMNIVFFLFSFPVAWTLYIVLQPLLAGILLYVYLRHRGLVRLASFTGALAWSFSGFTTAWLTWGTIVQTALWLPLILIAIDKIAGGRRWWSAVLVFAFSMTILAGHIQIALYILAFSLFYSFAAQVKGKKYPFWRFFLAGAVALLVTIPQWAPTFSSILTSARSGGAAWLREGFFIPWQHLVQFAVPDFFGNPATLNYWGVWNWAEFVGYIGMIPLMFAIMGVAANPAAARIWIWTLVIGLIFALPTVLAKLAYQLNVPLISALQPTRLLVLIDFALAVLAAIGVNEFLHKPRKLIYGIVPVGALLFACWVVVFIAGRHETNMDMIANFAVAKRNLVLPSMLFLSGAVLMFMSRFFARQRLVIIFCFIGLTIFDLLRFGWKFTPFTPIDYFFPETPVIQFLAKQPKPFRALALDERILPPNAASYFGIEMIEGYDPVYSKIYEGAFVAASRGDLHGGTAEYNRILTMNNVDSPLLPYFNVKYVLSLTPIDRPFLVKVFEEGETKVYEYKNAYPRVMVADQIFEKTKASEALAVLLREKGPSAVVSPGIDVLSVPLTIGESASILAYSNNEVVIQVTTANTRVIVISSTYDPGWKATLDNTPVNVIRVNHAFMGVQVPPGDHTLRLYYRPLYSILF